MRDRVGVVGGRCVGGGGVLGVAGKVTYDTGLGLVLDWS